MIEGASRLAREIETSPYAGRLGLEVGGLLGDTATASLPYRADLANTQGAVHGGAAASLSLWVSALAAVASDRSAGTVSATPVSIALNYVTAAREEALHATARIVERGREIAHAEVEVCSDRGRTVAMALVVQRLRPATAAAASAASSPTLEEADAGGKPQGRRLVSPFSQAMGIEVRPAQRAQAGLAMPAGPNRGPGGTVDPGALVAMADTCAALACMPSLDQRMLGSATLSLSAVFADDVLSSEVEATGRLVAEDGAVCSALVEARGSGEPGWTGRSREPRRTSALTACVSYRFLGAGSSR